MRGVASLLKQGRRAHMIDMRVGIEPIIDVAEVARQAQLNQRLAEALNGARPPRINHRQGVGTGIDIGIDDYAPAPVLAGVSQPKPPQILADLQPRSPRRLMDLRFALASVCHTL